MSRVLVLYYSSYGHVEAMAEAVAEGAASVVGTACTLKRVPETVTPNVAKTAGFKLDQQAPLATPQELADYDAIVFGTPTRFGNMTAQMRTFLDQTGSLWLKGALIGKLGSVFTSTSSQHGGQETTITSFHSTLLHHGMLIVGLPNSHPALSQTQQVAGGTPYGASCVTGSGADMRMPSATELALCRLQGEHVAKLAGRLTTVHAAAV